MNKIHISFRVMLLAAFFLPFNNLSADVLSSTTTSELIEPNNTYDSGTPSLLNMRVKTVIEDGPCIVDNYVGCTLRDVLDDIDGNDDFKPEIKVHMTADDYPDDGLRSNAEMRQRGSTSRGAPQKSFRIKFDDDVALWRGEDRVQLLKSFWDFSRIRNKLSYDLFVDIPNLPSMRTQFVNFKVDDQGSVEDYGLYTQVEYVGKEYLLRRGWNKDSRLYKAENFYFRDTPAFNLDAAGEPLDEDAFEQFMEIKRGDDHRKFVTMVKDLNNPSLDFNSQVFNKYFNRDNYLTWFAVNILLDNYDTNFHNFYLYNPKGSQKFYFLPWDYDLTLGAVFDTGSVSRDSQARWTKSHANWWGQELHQQFLRQPGNLRLLREAMDEIKAKFLSPFKLQEKADSYYNIVFPMISRDPDIDKLYLGGSDPEKVAAYNRLFSSLASRVNRNYNQFAARIGDPMPFTLRDPVVENQNYRFSWSPSESLIGQTIRYDLEVSTSAKFESGTIVASRNGLQSTTVSIPWSYGTGRHYYRVTARDASLPERYLQVAYNQVSTSDGPVYGVVSFNSTIGNNNTFPVGRPDTATTDQRTAITIDVLANDEGSGLVITNSNAYSEKGGRVSIVSNKIRYQPKSTFTGTDRLWYVFRDAAGRSTFSVATITVTGTNTGAYPVGNPDNVSTAQNTRITIDVLANDTGSGLSITSSNPWSLKGGRVDITNNRIVYTPKQGFSGEDKLWYVFQDSQGRTNSSSATINVNSTSAYPVAITDNVAVTFNRSVTFNALSNDTGSGLRITEVNAYSVNGGRVAIVNGQLRYTPKTGFRGTDSFWYAIADSLNRTNSAKVSVTVR